MFSAPTAASGAPEPTVAANQASEASGGASEPAATATQTMASPAAAAVENGLPLHELNRDTAKVGKWYFRVCHGQTIACE